MSLLPRFALSLGTRIFLITALLLLLAVGAAVAVTALLGGRIAREAARQSLASSGSVQAAFQQQRYEQLQLIARILASDSSFVAYVEEAAGRGEPGSILDLLDERQGELGFDFAMVLDPAGRLLARTGGPAAPGTDLSRRPLVATALDEYQAAGVWREGGELYSAVAVPIAKDLTLVGFLVIGFAIDDLLALEVKRISGAEVAFLAATPEGPAAVASTLAPEALEGLLRGLGAGERGGSEAPPSGVELPVAGRTWIAVASPLRDAAGGEVGSTVSLASLDQELATYRRIQTVLIVVGGVAILLAFAGSYVLSRRTMGPVRRLAAAAEAARRGEYEQAIGAERGDEVGQLAGAFRGLLAELREKRDMEAYVADLERNLPEPPKERSLVEPAAQRISLVAVELRRFAQRRLAADPPEAVAELGKELRRVVAAASAQRGRILAVAGHRVLAAFAGDAGVYRALSAASEIRQGLSVAGSSFDEITPPVIAVATGEAVVGSAVWGEQPEPVIIGLPVHQLEALLREAAPGDLLVSEEVREEVAVELAGAGIELRPQRGVFTTQTVYALGAEASLLMSGMQTAVMAAGTGGSAAGGAPPAGRSTLSEIGPGTLLGDRFEILSVLGAGGMGVVYKARDRELDDLVALKMLKPEVGDDLRHLERLKSELKLARKITHPNVLRTFDFGELDGFPFISMEYVRGVTLRFLLDREGRLPFYAGLRLGKQLVAGLEAAHDVGVLHRDIKPENLILDHGGSARLMDFGIARPVRRSGPGQTQEGFLVGTPHYMAPEQIAGREPDPRTDIYATGVLLFEVFTGTLPFGGDTPLEILLKHQNEPPPAPRERWPEIPGALETLLLRCLQKDPDRRYRTSGDLRRALEVLGDG